MKPYLSYNFIDKDPVIDKIRTMIQDEKVSMNYIAEKSGVAVSTLRSWFEGRVKRPQHPTVMAVVKALGYEVTYQKAGKVVPFRKQA